MSFGSVVVAAGNTGEAMCILDLHAHSQYKSHPLVANSPHFGFFLGAPLVVGDAIIGCLCAWDYAPKSLVSVKDCMILQDLAKVMSILLSHNALRRTWSSIHRGNVTTCLTAERSELLQGVVTSVESISKSNTEYHYVGSSVCEGMGITVIQNGARTRCADGEPNTQAHESLRNCNLRALLQFVRNKKPSVPSNTSLPWESVVWHTDGIPEDMVIRMRQAELLGDLLTDTLSHLWHLSRRIEVSCHVCGFGSIAVDSLWGSAEKKDDRAPFEGPRPTQHAGTEASIRTCLLQGSESSKAALHHQREVFAQVEVRIYAVGRTEGNLQDLLWVNGDTEGAPNALVHTLTDRVVGQSKSVDAMEGKVTCVCHDKNDVEWIVKVPCSIRLRDDFPQQQEGEWETETTVLQPTVVAGAVKGDVTARLVGPRTEAVPHFTIATSKECAECIRLPPSGTLCVLVVDDTPSIQKLLRRWLEKQGCEVTSAMNGVEGLASLKRSYGKAYDVVFMDFLMPLMGGVQCLTEFAEWRASSGIDSDRFNDTLIVGLSATADEDEQNLGFAAGMHQFFPKPPNMTVLSNILAMKKDGQAIRDIIKL